MRLFHKMFMIACLASAAAALPGLARADEPPPAVKAFLDNLERQSAIKPAYDSLTVGADGTVTISNLTISEAAKGDQPGFTVKTAETTFSGITEEAPSLYRVGKASFTNTTLGANGGGFSFSVEVPAASAEDWYIRAVGASPTPQEEVLASGYLARKMNSGRMTITMSGQTISVDGIESAWTGDAATGSGLFNMKVNNVSIPEGLIAAIDQGGMLKQMGYQGVNLDVSSSGETKVSGEALSYTFDFGVSARDMASIRFGGSASDIPLAAYSALVKAQHTGQQPDFTPLMPQIQNITVKDASFRFEDASIVKKVLPLAAAMQGMDEKTLVASIPPTVQIMLIQLQNEAFTKQAVEAVTRFFAEPKSLTLSARPAAPLKLSEIWAMDPNKPGDAITKLGLSLTANE